MSDQYYNSDEFDDSNSSTESEFYDYLSKKLINFFHNKISQRQKFYIEVDEKEQVSLFLNSLKKQEEAFDYTFTNDSSEYPTFYLDFNGIKLLIGSSLDATSNYLTYLRNEISDNEKYENFSLLVISHRTIDSINDGTGNLMKKGMPLNLESISKNLVNEIEKSEHTLGNKERIKFYLKYKEDELFKTTLYDYEDILSILNKDDLSYDDYLRLELFPDENLEGVGKRNIQKRLKQNHEIFDDVLVCKESINAVEELEKKFDTTGVNYLKKDDWHKTDFQKLLNSIERFSISEKKLKYFENKNKVTKEGLTYWERTKNDKETGPRFILVFNDKNVEEISFDLNFDSTIYKDKFKQENLDFVDTSGKSIKISIKVNKGECIFKRFDYEHNVKSKFKFFILVIPFTKEIFKSIKTRFYLINSLNSKKFSLGVFRDDDEDIIFGMGKSKDIEVKSNQDLSYSSSHLIKNSIIISERSPGWVKSSLDFNLIIDNVKIPIKIEENKKTNQHTYNSLTLWKLKRENQENIFFNGIKAIQGSKALKVEDSFKQYWNMELEIIEKDILFGQKIDGCVEKIELNINEELISSYQQILDYYKEINNVPSLVYLDDKLRGRYENFLELFNHEIENIRNGTPLANQEKKLDLFKIGLIKEKNSILFSSLSPLNIAYQLEFNNQCKNEFLKDNILERLTPNNLVPYVFGKNRSLYKPVFQTDAHEWLRYERINKVAIGTTNHFIADIVREKIEQFISHFEYLFSLNNKSPIILNIINIPDDLQVIKGIFEFIRLRLIDKGEDEIIPIELNIYSDSETSSLEELFNCETKDHLDDLFKITFKEGKYSLYEIISIVQQNIKYYKYPKDVDSYNYAHISFYNSGFDETPAPYPMKDINTGLSLNGLISSVNSNIESDFRYGFGTKDILDETNILVRTVTNFNELVSNYDNDGLSHYVKKSSISTLPSYLDPRVAKNLYEVSHWVTFINPSFGLEFLEKSSGVDGAEGLIVIHYSDQYTASSRYDTITVTSRYKQYENIIEEFLKEKADINIIEEFLKEKADSPSDSLKDLIKLFNSINGEWLLRSVTNEEGYGREKLSIISAVKYCLAILDHPEIVWIPISMEEILRIAGNVKLSKSEGIFSVKNVSRNMKTKGVHSDDLLFIGVRSLSNGKIQLYYHPIEVKIGNNVVSTITKGMNQIENTSNLLKEQLNKIVDDDEFKNKFFRNFFIQILLANEEKFSINHIWDEKFLNSFEGLKCHLLNDDYDVSADLENIIGVGSVVSFKKDEPFPNIEKEDNIQIIELTENHAYVGLVKSIKEIYKEIQSEDSIISHDKLLSSIKDLDSLEHIEFAPKDDSDSMDVVSTGVDSGGDDGFVDVVSTGVDSGGDDGFVDVVSTTADSKIPLEDIRAYIGTAKGSNFKVYWEYGHPELDNRHMVIQGKSGQGKTYFIQRMLKELSNQGVPSIIIDYTDGFKKSMLEPAFISSLTDKIDEHVVFKDKFPLNPFKRYGEDYEGEFVYEDDSDIAGRFKSLLQSVYNLGDQQAMVIYRAVSECLKQYGQDFSFIELKEEISKENTSVSKSVLSKLIQLFDINPFDSENEFSWEDALENSDGKVTIIQLTRLSKDIQKVVTEIILRDLWNYKLLKGSEDNPFIVVLDEAHHLDFSEDSPSSNILNEGRKYGWSGWFATQSIKGSMTSKEISKLDNASEKIFFHPTDVTAAAKELSSDTSERKKWHKELESLTKGNCIVKGYILNYEGKFIKSKPLCVKIDEITFDEPKNTGEDYEDDSLSNSKESLVIEDSLNLPEPIVSFGHDTTPQLSDDENIKCYNEFLENQAGKHITKEGDEFIISRVIRGKEKVFGKFNSMEVALDYEQKFIRNAWDNKYYAFAVTYGKHINKENNKFTISRIINGKRINYGTFNTLYEALMKREELIDDNWGVDGDIDAAVEEIYGNYITFENDAFSLVRKIDGEVYNFGKYDTLENAALAKEILISNKWDGYKIPESLFSWRSFAKYNPPMKSYEVLNLIGEDALSFGLFPSKINAKKAIKILKENNWDMSHVPLDLYTENSNIRHLKREDTFAVIRRVNGLTINFGTFDTLEEAIEERNKLFLSNWSFDEDEDYPNENIYLRSGKYYVKYEIDGVMTTFDIFDTFEDALEFRNLCSRGGWDSSLIQVQNEEIHFTEQEDFSFYLEWEKEYNSKIDEMHINEQIHFEDILGIFNSIDTLNNPDFPVPQVNNFSMVFDLCERLYEEYELSKDDTCFLFDLANRQYRYLISAGQYLGLIDQVESGVKLSNKGLEIFSLDFKEKYLAIVKSILETTLFNQIFKLCLENNEIPSLELISEILVDYNISGSTIKRRASSIRGWVSWIVSLYGGE